MVPGVFLGAAGLALAALLPALFAEPGEVLPAAVAGEVLPAAFAGEVLPASLGGVATLGLVGLATLPAAVASPVWLEACSDSACSLAGCLAASETSVVEVFSQRSCSSDS